MNEFTIEELKSLLKLMTTAKQYYWTPIDYDYELNKAALYDKLLSMINNYGKNSTDKKKPKLNRYLIQSHNYNVQGKADRFTVVAKDLSELEVKLNKIREQTTVNILAIEEIDSCT